MLSMLIIQILCYDIHFDNERQGVVYALWAQVQNAPYAAAENYLTTQWHLGISYDAGLRLLLMVVVYLIKCSLFMKEMKETFIINGKKHFGVTKKQALRYCLFFC